MQTENTEKKEKRELRPYQKRERKRILLRLVRILAATLIAVAIGLLNQAFPFRNAIPSADVPPRQEGEMRLHFLDIGQGDCTIAEFPDGQIVVIDGGDGGYRNDIKLRGYLKGLHAEKISIVCTHADLDHSGGLSSLFRSFSVEKVYLPCIPSGGSLYREFLESAEAVGTEVLNRYDLIGGGDCYALCLSPYSEGETVSNEASAVLYFSCYGVTAMLTSDIPEAREALLLREYKMYPSVFDRDEYRVTLENIDILKVAHHGSAESSSKDWLSLLSPAAAVISCGRYNSYGHPDPSAVARLLTYCGGVYRTDELGDIVVTISPAGGYALSYLNTKTV